LINNDSFNCYIINLMEQESGTYEVEEPQIQTNHDSANIERGTEVGMPPLVVVVQGGKSVK